MGRIVSEAETGALNEQSVLLEGSREASAGARVRLDLSHLPSYRLFPGQVRQQGSQEGRTGWGLGYAVAEEGNNLLCEIDL